ncbi:MAG TPA: hypothetical protein VEL74_13060 [Thermoanaerobaculia bacterium]|nr:hypothetical protein [Thermoanaerobaculia bacterium]
MRSFDDRSSSAIHPNAFDGPFLRRLAERDEPPTAGDADVAGPWRIEEIPQHGFGLFRLGESLSRGFAPVAIFPSRWLALLMAAILPGTGRDPLVRLEKLLDVEGGYPLVLPGPDGGEVVGRFQLFDEAAVDALNVAVHLLQAPESLAYLLEAAGAVTLERCGAILDERTAAPQ